MTAGTIAPGRAYRLTPDVIRTLVPHRVPGTYRLHLRGSVVYLGRSDTNLRRRLLEHSANRRGEHFTWQVHRSAMTAYADECSQWHDLPALAQNLVHPARPDGSVGRCPFCPKTLNLVVSMRAEGNRNGLES